jgi:photosystem II stability/assembly factor-like uncharacterized protein
MRRTPILLATSMCLAVLVTVAGPGSVAFGAGSESAARSSSIPVGFRAQSLSWVSPLHGWMLGYAPCGQNTCTTVVGTTDGGTTWNKLGHLHAPLSFGEKMSGVERIRFADDLNGWAFKPALWATTDGGATWTKQTPPGGGSMVLALEGNAQAAYAVVSACTFNRPISECSDPVTLWRTTPGEGSWTQVSLTLPVAAQADLAVHGTVAYLIVRNSSEGPDILNATVDGQHWSSRPDPCVKVDESLTSVAPISDTKVAMLCVANIGFGKAAKRVVRSKDTGQTTSSAGKLPLYGITSQLAAAPNGTLAVSSWSIGSWIYLNQGGRTWSTPVDLGDGGEGWYDIVFTTNQIGWIVHGPAACCGGSGPGQLAETTDGGLTWAPVS